MRRLLPLAALALALAGCGGGKVVTPTPETIIGTVEQGPTGTAAGKAVYDANGCGGCHTFKPAGSSGKVGPDLDKLAADATKANHGSLSIGLHVSPVETWMRTSCPDSQRASCPRSRGRSTDAQINDLVAFLTKSS
jgi:cytochrome c2